MNVERLINMVISRVIRTVVNKGINAGINAGTSAISKRKGGSDPDPEAQARLDEQGKRSADQARKMAKLARRSGRL